LTALQPPAPILVGIQAAINMSVNLPMIPAKGHDIAVHIPGGSSIVSLAYGTA